MKQYLEDVTSFPGAKPGYDQHVRCYYDQPANNFEQFSSSKFEGEIVALAVAFNASLEGFQHDDFGNVDQNGYYCRVLFDDCPWIVCFVEDSNGFVTQVSNEVYEAAQAEEYSEEYDDDVADYNDDKDGNYKGFSPDNYR